MSLVSPRPLLVGVAVASAAALAAALVSQHVFGMQPCAWCVLQRLVFTVIGVAAALGAVFAGRGPQRTAAAVVGLLALGGIGAALWQHFVAASSVSCDLSLADRIMSGLGIDMALPEVYAPFASCADAKVDLFGVPYEFWSLALFVALALAAVQVWRRAR